MFLAVDGRPAGALVVSDPLKPSTPEALDLPRYRLHKLKGNLKGSDSASQLANYLPI